MAYAEFISLWYIPAGVSFAAFLILGKRAFFPIFLGIWYVSLNFSTLFDNGFDPTHLATSLLFSLAHTLSYAIGGLGARYWLSHFHLKPLPLKIIGLLSMSIVAALLAAISGLMVWEYATENYQNIIATGWFAWWLGDLIGVIVITPILCLVLPKINGQQLAWIDIFFEHDKRLPNTYVSYCVKLATAIVIISAIMLLDSVIDHPGVAYFIFFLAIPQLWIVFTEKTSLASISLLVITSIIAFGVGVFDVTDQAITYQFSLFVMALMSYFAITIPALVQQNNALKELAMLDVLTQLPTRWLTKTLVEQVIKSSKPNQNHSIALFDIDHFKTINQEYGETIGDSALQQFAKIVQHELRDSEILCRFQGDSFALFMPNLDLSQAKARAEEIRQKMPVLQLDELVLPIRGSFGVVQVQFGESFDEAVQRARQATKQAKSNGRNCVVALA